MLKIIQDLSWLTEKYLNVTIYYSMNEENQSANQPNTNDQNKDDSSRSPGVDRVEKNSPGNDRGDSPGVDRGLNSSENNVPQKDNTDDSSKDSQ